MATYRTARFHVKPESLARCSAAIEEFVAYIRGNEPGTKLYMSLVEETDPHSFLHVMIFEDEAAEQKHRQSESVKRFTGRLYPELYPPGAAVEFGSYRLIATNSK